MILVRDECGEGVWGRVGERGECEARDVCGEGE